jgi:energy-coupling factor transport system permease protein
MGKTSIGQYIPGQTWFHSRDPRARLIVFILLFIGVLFASIPLALTLALICVLAIYGLAKLPLAPSFDGMKRAIPFILILAVLQIIFYSPSPNETILFSLIGIDVTVSILISASMLIFRFIVLITLINGLVMSISTAQISAALFHLLKPFEKFGFPVNDLIVVVQITLRYIPIIAQIAEKIAKAQASRGGDWEQRGFNPIRQAKRVLPLIIPIIINSLKRAETMAIAMESRGFNAAEKRSCYYELRFNWQDSLLIVVTIIFSTLMIISGQFF